MNKGDIFFIKLEGKFITLSDSSTNRRIESNISIEFPNPVWLEVEFHKFFSEGNNLNVILRGGKLEMPSSNTKIDSEFLNQVNKISFHRGLDTGLLLQMKKESSKGSKEKRPIKVPKIQPFEIEDQPSYRLAPQETVQKKLIVRWEELALVDGGISFTERIEGSTFDIFVPNSFIRKEFEAIKMYLKKALNLPTILVEIEIETDQNTISSVASKDIDKIDQSIIQKIKIPFTDDFFIKNTFKEPVDEPLTAGELFTKIKIDGLDMPDLFEDQKELLDTLIQAVNPKHSQNLAYLSQKHNYSKTNLFFYLKPFSFLFYLELEDKILVVWETLNTEEATYIWSFGKYPNSVESIIKGCKAEIGFIINNSKTEYISQHKENFHRIIHDYSDVERGYRKWKKKLLEI